MPRNSALRRLQDSPHLLELAYHATHRLLWPFRRWLRPGGRVERLFVRVERASKGPLFDCHMCGQCILHSTGMTCPMTCPKQMRNGPCGGVRPDGACEVYPTRPCVWAQAWERSKQMPRFGAEILAVQPPVNRQLHRTSAWINDFTGASSRPPAGWSA
ncbi:MAG: methylenetetrahydrofolate reductase C-terminal domain-containing protein [Chloroflexi bacterium]|nr:methylenetetrahydrofolate reductase C-terminal domain-containing protein [Chloroflexota bacterium]